MIKLQKLDLRATFTRAHPSDAGYDLTCCSIFYDKSSKLYIAHFGIKTELPPMHFAIVALRSSTAIRGWRLANGVGIVDTDFRGEWRGLLYCNTTFSDETSLHIAEQELLGKRIAQAIILSTGCWQIEEVEAVSKTTRNEGGFGSTGK